jgi:hypothetical protein
MEKAEFRPPALPVKPASNEPPANLQSASASGNDESERLKREAILETLIQQTRTANSLPLLSPDELDGQLLVWSRLLATVPRLVLEPAWDLAARSHDWSRGALLPGHVLEAGGRVIAEDRERRERAGALERHRYLTEGTYSCRRCSVDHPGYVAMLVYCGTFNDWRRAVYPCECEAAPVSQRRPWPGSEHWERNRDSGVWTPPDRESSVLCICKFCQAGYSGKGGSNGN